MTNYSDALLASVPKMNVPREHWPPTETQDRERQKNPRLSLLSAADHKERGREDIFSLLPILLQQREREEVWHGLPPHDVLDEHCDFSPPPPSTLVPLYYRSLYLRGDSILRSPPPLRSWLGFQYSSLVLGFRMKILLSGENILYL